jgi:hypothetical protein
LIFATSCTAEELSDDVTYSSGDINGSSRDLSGFARTILLNSDGESVVQTSVRELSHPESDVSVVLVSMIHIGPSAYFRELTQFVSEADLVIAEGLDPHETIDEVEFSKAELLMGRSYQALAQLLNLTLQIEWQASVAGEHWRYVDLEGEVAAAAAGDLEVPELIEAQVLRWETALGSESESDKNRARKEAHRALAVFAESLRHARDSSELDIKRERAMWDEIVRCLSSHECKRVALVFGAWHTAIFEGRLVRELGFERGGTRWIECLRYEAPVIRDGLPPMPR